MITPLAVAPPPIEPRGDLSRAPAGKASADAAPPPPLPIPPVEKPLAPPAVAAERFADRAEPKPGDAKLGTAHGALEWSVSHTVSFVRATPYPQLSQRIEYDSYANLAAAGVIASPPRAFPGNGGVRGFVPDPPARF